MAEIILILEQWITNAGVWAPIAFMLSFVVVVVIVPLPASPLGVLGGALFGPLLGFIFTLCGATLGALTAFWITRFSGRIFLKKFFPESYKNGNFNIVDGHLKERDIFVAVFLLRIFPLPVFDAVSYGAGLTHIRARFFALATFFGMMPVVFTLSYFGDILTQNMVLFVVFIVIISFAGGMYALRVRNNHSSDKDSTRKN